MNDKLSVGALKELPVVNVMERVVDDHFPAVMKKFPGACCCRQCLSDIKALTLNNLKPHYVSSAKGDVFARVNTSDMLVKIEVLRAMTEAVERVSKNPRHGNQ